jgi:hypothetical protein
VTGQLNTGRPKVDSVTKGMAGKRFEMQCRWYPLIGFVIAGNHPHLAASLEAHLAGSQDVASRVK